jgi:DNA-binding XRE family transcriptional regulator
MTNYDETAGTEDPKFLLEELRRTMDAEDSTSALPDEPTDNETWGDSHLGEAQLSSSAVMMAAADLVIPPQEPRPEARSRMIEAAGRALAERRKTNGLLPVLLRTAREQRGMTVADVAGKTQFPEQTIRALEAGDAEVNLHLAVDTTVAWIRSVPVDRTKALDSLRRSLQTGWTGDLTLAAGMSERSASVDEYIERVAARLDSDNEEEAP